MYQATTKRYSQRYGERRVSFFKRFKAIVLRVHDFKRQVVRFYCLSSFQADGLQALVHTTEFTQSSLSSEARDRGITRTFFDLSSIHPHLSYLTSRKDLPMQLTNRLEPGFFCPNEGKPFPSSDENIRLATNGKLKKYFPWWTCSALTNDNTGSSNEDTHPVTRTKERYSMYDRFHEKNSNNPDDVLRRLVLCPQLHANVNSESHEQLHSVMNKDNYFLNMMQPATHVFMKRLLVHLRNDKKKTTRKSAVKSGHCKSMDQQNIRPQTHQEEL